MLTSDKVLGEQELLDLSRYLSSISVSGTPLAAGLDALAQESTSRKLRSSLLKLSARLKSGESAESVFGSEKSPLPNYFRGVIAAGVRSGQLGLVLERYVTHTQRTADLKRRCLAALSYPCLLILMIVVLVVGIDLFVIPNARDIFNGFQLELPGVTRLLFWQADLISNYLPALYLIISIAGLLMIGITRLGGSTILQFIPIIGPVFFWTRLAECYGFLQILVAQQLPVPLALSLTSETLSDRQMGRKLKRIANDVRGGMSLGNAILQRMPHGLGLVIAWGEKNEGLAPTLELARDIAEKRAEAQSDIARIALPPLLMVFVAFLVYMSFIGLIAPLLILLRALGGN